MSRTTLADLRGHLFDTIERLKEGNDPEADPKDTIDLDRAKCIAGVAGQIIQSAKVEVDAMKIVSQHSISYDPIKHLESTGVIQDAQKMLGE